MKRMLLTASVVMCATLGSTLASAAAYPRIRNPGTERICADPQLFESIAAGLLCRNYYNNNTWDGAGGRFTVQPGYDRGYYRSADGSDRSFYRVGNNN
jgi:hypothetical protein